MRIEYTLEGFNLHQPEHGFKLMVGSEYASTIAPRRINIHAQGAHGEIPSWNDPLDATNLTLRVRIEDRDPAGLEHKWTYLRSLLRTGGNNPITVRRISAGRVVATYAQLLSMSQPDFYQAAGLVTSTIILHIPSGRWESVAASEQSLAIPGTGQIVVFAAESSGPVTNALLRVRGPLTSLAVRDNTSDTGARWQGVVNANQYLLVNCGNFTAWRKAGDEWEDGGTNVSDGLETIGNGMLALVPQPSFVIGANSNSTTVTASGMTGNTQLHILGRRTYI